MRIALVTTLWKRHELERRVLRYFAELPMLDPGKVDDWIGIAVGSEGAKSEAVARDYGWEYVEHSNNPLTFKTQAGVYAAREFEPDYVVLINSDDVLSFNFLEAVTQACPPDGALGLTSLWFWCTLTKRLAFFSGYHQHQRTRRGLYARNNRTLGTGRTFGRELLERVNWKLWAVEKNSGVDRACDTHLYNVLGEQSIQAYSMEELGVWAMDIKTKTNIWPLRRYKCSSILDGDAMTAVLQLMGLDDFWAPIECEETAAVVDGGNGHVNKALETAYAAAWPGVKEWQI